MQDEEAIVPQENQALRAWWEEEDRQWILNSRSFSGSCKKLIADYFATSPWNGGCCVLVSIVVLVSLSIHRAAELITHWLAPPPPIDPTLLSCVPTSLLSSNRSTFVVSHRLVWGDDSALTFPVPVVPSTSHSWPLRVYFPNPRQINSDCCSCDLPTNLETFTSRFVDLMVDQVRWWFINSPYHQEWKVSNPQKQQKKDISKHS